MKALFHGVPVVALPFGRDPKDIAVRIEVSRALAFSLSPASSAASLATAVRRVLQAPAFRDAAQRMAAVLAHNAKQDRAVG
jgi:UDP:flavonoid glycosyltransferase YjiC (YdhE family)